MRPRYLQADFLIAAAMAVAAARVAWWIITRGVDATFVTLGYLAFIWLLMEVLDRRMANEGQRHRVRKNGSWPPLPDDSLVRGRSATAEDVRGARAVFVMADVTGKPGSPVDLELPQYGLVDATPVAIVQAETDGVATLIGYQDLVSGDLDFSRLEEVTLLGRTPATTAPAGLSATTRSK